MTTSPQERFREFYWAHYEAILGFATRRAVQPADATDVVAETFLVAWRRLDDVPGGSDARLWLYGVARNVLATQLRGDLRRSALGTRLREQLGEDAQRDHAGSIAEQLWVRDCLGQLREPDREVLVLNAWDGLEPREIAALLGIAPEAARARLSRARARLRDVMGDRAADRPADAAVDRNYSTEGLA